MHHSFRYAATVCLAYVFFCRRAFLFCILSHYCRCRSLSAVAGRFGPAASSIPISSALVRFPYARLCHHMLVWRRRSKWSCRAPGDDERVPGCQSKWHVTSQISAGGRCVINRNDRLHMLTKSAIVVHGVSATALIQHVECHRLISCSGNNVPFSSTLRLLIHFNSQRRRVDALTPQFLTQRGKHSAGKRRPEASSSTLRIIKYQKSP
jgi:hypothetical protein